MKVSMIITYYECESFLFELFANIKTMDFFEIIIVDDYSSKYSFQKLKKITQKFSNIKIIQNFQNKGLSYSRNKGIEVAQGDYIFFLDADDWLNIGSIEYMLQLIDEYKDIDMFIFNDVKHLEYYEEEISYDKDKYYFGTNINYLTYRHMSACVKLYKKELFEKIRFKEGIMYEDLYLLSDIYNIPDLKVLNTQTYLYNYRINPDSITNTNFDFKKYSNYIACFEKFKFDTPIYIYEFMVLRASKHLLFQAGKSAEGKEYYENLLNVYYQENDINTNNALYDIWSSGKFDNETKSELFKLIEKDEKLFRHLQYKNDEIEKRNEWMKSKDYWLNQKDERIKKYETDFFIKIYCKIKKKFEK